MEDVVAIQMTYSKARAHFAALLDEAGNSNELVVIERKGKAPVAMIALSELEGLTETAHLLRSPRNRTRLLAAIDKSTGGRLKPMSVEALAKAVGLA